jgi:cytoskeletal protein CcmA (bactofilin family)
MAIFTPQGTAKKEAASFNPDPPPFRETPANTDAMPAAAPAPAPSSRADTQAKESLIASDLTIEGKIEGAGHVRIAGRFKGDVNVQGDLTLDAGAKLTGSVRARKVVVAGELEGNIDGAQRVELIQGGVLVGDVKAGSLTVAAGSRMRGQADFGWDEKKNHGASATSTSANGMEAHAAS